MKIVKRKTLKDEKEFEKKKSNAFRKLPDHLLNPVKYYDKTEGRLLSHITYN